MYIGACRDCREYCQQDKQLSFEKTHGRKKHTVLGVRSFAEDNEDYIYQIQKKWHYFDRELEKYFTALRQKINIIQKQAKQRIKDQQLKTAVDSNDKRLIELARTIFNENFKRLTCKDIDQFNQIKNHLRKSSNFPHISSKQENFAYDIIDEIKKATYELGKELSSKKKDQRVERRQTRRHEQDKRQHEDRDNRQYHNKNKTQITPNQDRNEKAREQRRRQDRRDRDQQRGARQRRDRDQRRVVDDKEETIRRQRKQQKRPRLDRQQRKPRQERVKEDRQQRKPREDRQQRRPREDRQQRKPREDRPPREDRGQRRPRQDRDKQQQQRQRKRQHKQKDNNRQRKHGKQQKQVKFFPKLKISQLKADSDEFSIDLKLIRLVKVVRERDLWLVSDQTGEARLIIPNHQSFKNGTNITLNNVYIKQHGGQLQIIAKLYSTITSAQLKDIDIGSFAKKQKHKQRPRPTGHPQTNFIKIDDLQPDSQNFTMVAKVISVVQKGSIIQCVIGDETGIVNSRFASGGELLKKDNTIFCRGVKVEMTKQAKILITEGDKFQIQIARQHIKKIKEDNNVSAREYEEADD